MRTIHCKCRHEKKFHQKRIPSTYVNLGRQLNASSKFEKNISNWMLFLQRPGSHQKPLSTLSSRNWRGDFNRIITTESSLDSLNSHALIRPSTISQPILSPATLSDQQSAFLTSQTKAEIQKLLMNTGHSQGLKYLIVWGKKVAKCK